MNNNKIVTLNDTITVNTFLVNETIDDNLNWTGEKGIIYRSLKDISMTSSWVSGLWRDMSPKYIGIRIEQKDKVFYGWIKVANNWGLIIYNYACTIPYEL
ncbi:MAG: hypothetical protein JW833_15090 [Prolixibacteraceae bacterium]|nr:hypothetical protein [Prolixibacteraceae bacterium]